MDVDSAVQPIDDIIEQTEHRAKELKRDIDGEVQTISSAGHGCCSDIEERLFKRAKTEENGTSHGQDKDKIVDKANEGYKKGVAPIKKEFLLRNDPEINMSGPNLNVDDDAAEAGGCCIPDAEKDDEDRRGKKQKKKQRGQNKGRRFQFQHDAVQLCPHLNLSPTTASPFPCLRMYVDKNCEGENDKTKVRGNGYVDPHCKFEHDIKKYLATGKKIDLKGSCPVWDQRGECIAGGWRCRWLNSHCRKLENGEMELVVDEERKKKYIEKVISLNKGDEPKVVAQGGTEILNEVGMSHKAQLRKQQFPFKKSQEFLDAQDKVDLEPEENRAMYIEQRIPRWEKKPVDISPERPILSPLTTVGNLPFRRLCTQLGAAMTYSEMAMSLPLIQGQKSEWALLRCHASEVPNFGAQICAMKPWQAVKAAEAITNLIPSQNMSLIDLNCGCPIDMVYQSGGGSALLDQHGKLLKMLRGMNRVSGETPITCKIRMGTKDNNPTAKRLLRKLFDCGDVAAITLHGRSRQQRYTKEADWTYISECATLVNSLKHGVDNQHSISTSTIGSSPSTKQLNIVQEYHATNRDDGGDITDSSAFGEGHDLPQITSSSVSGHGLGGRTGHGPYFIGNGDIYSHEDYFTHVSSSPIDSAMVARGALIKPWIFEEISKRQYLDKTPSERIGYIKDFIRYGLDTWGSDEFGIQTTRRFLCEWLSFSCRYVPLGILERLPPKIQDRPPLWRGRDEMETLLGSNDVRDWTKISEMFLGKVGEGSGWSFVPKHKSNAHGEMEAEG